MSRPSTVAAEIDAKIFDALDCAYSGRVDYDPLYGGVSPTDATAALALSGTAAAPTAAGAQVTFSLSSAASVSARVLNLAGRPVSVLCTDRECEAGANLLLWSARSDQGLPVPSGTYLIEVAARTEDGAQSRALTQVRISR